MRNALFVSVSMLLLAACSATQAQNTLTATQVFCHVGSVAQPVAVTLGAAVTTAVAPSTAPAVAGAVAIDNTLVHPAVVSGPVFYYIIGIGNSAGVAGIAFVFMRVGVGIGNNV